VAQARSHGSAIVAQFAGCGGREAAYALRGMQIAVPRSALPDTRDNEFYWIDLIGLTAVNAAGEELGTVVRILETGANDVLVVQGRSECLVPFIAAVVDTVDLAKGVIRVDWSAEY
jgi:16S rRNA processing protein RimM